MSKKDVKAVPTSEVTKAKQSENAKTQPRKSGKFDTKPLQPALAPTPNAVTKKAIKGAETGELKQATSSSDLMKTLSAESLLTALLVANKVENLIKGLDANRDYPESKIQKQIQEFNSWAQADSTLPDIPAPDENYRYDLFELIVGDELQLKALRRLGYEHYLAQELPLFLSHEERKDPAKYSIFEAALDSVVLESHLPDHPRKTGRIYYLRSRFPFEEVRGNFDKAKGFDKNSPESSEYTREIMDFPLGRRVWVYTRNKKYKG